MRLSFFRHLLAVTALMLFLHNLYGQKSFDSPVVVGEDLPLLTYLSDLEAKHHLSFFYIDQWLMPFKMKKQWNGLPLKEALANTLHDTNIDFVFLYDYAIIFYKNPSQDKRRDELVKKAIREKKYIEEITIGTQTDYIPEKKVILNGVIKDDKTGLPLPGAAVYIEELRIGSISDSQGKYELQLPAGEYLLNFRYVTYKEKIVRLSLYHSGQLDAILQPQPLMLEELVVLDHPIVHGSIGQSRLQITELKRSPSFLGQADVIKQLQLQPGVTTTSEASSGFIVRGGGVDQNLVLYDGVTIFNTSHLLGFFTAFNTEAIKESSFYKGGIPPEFGGRTSSVLKITSRGGDYHQWHGSGGVSLISSHLTLGGPIRKDSSSLMVSIRSSYSDWILKLLQTRYKGISTGAAFFYDGSVKYTHNLSQRNKLTWSSYTSTDQFSLATDTVNHWRNLATSIALDHTIQQNFSYTTRLSLGRYGYTVEEKERYMAYILRYAITYPSLQIDFNKSGNKHKKLFGLHATFYVLEPGALEPTTKESNIDRTKIPVERALESAVYFQDAFNVGSKVQVDGGLRISMFNRLGSGMVYLYEPNKPREKETTRDSIMYAGSKIMKTYLEPEPRLSVTYLLNTNVSLKLGYHKMYQYVHLITNSAVVTPVDIWQVSNTYFKPQIADQISLGYFMNSTDHMLEISAEAFYKFQKNLLDFKDGANLILNRKLETALLSGIGKSYGAEFSIAKTKGGLTGQVNYTYSRSLRKVNGDHDAEKINGGTWYPSNADQPHIVNAQWRVNLRRRIFFTGTFTYHTGRPASIPTGSYLSDGIVITDFDARNNHRLRAYHRLDIALVIEGSNKKNRKFEGSWLFSIYNIYGRRNPYTMFYSHKGGGVLKPYQLSLIGTAVPSVTYTFKF